MNPLLQSIHQQLGISASHIERCRLDRHEQPALAFLEVVDIDFEGRPFILVQAAANGWRSMVDSAKEDHIFLKPFSGFRSYIHQKNLIEKNLKLGRLLEEILTQIAIPGYSEHHSGRAVDVHADGRGVLEEAFETTEEFKWLTTNAARFHFRLSYPRSNPQGIIYEPWHWFYTGT